MPANAGLHVSFAGKGVDGRESPAMTKMTGETYAAGTVDPAIAGRHGHAGEGPLTTTIHLVPNPEVTISAVRFGNHLPLALIAGPCALESRDHALEMASALKEIAAKIGIGLVYKTSFDKANRTSAKRARALGLGQW